MSDRDHRAAPVPAAAEGNTAKQAASAAGQRRHPLRFVADKLTSVRLGIVTLSALFVYAAIGSAGHYPVIRDGSLAWSRQMVRQLRPFEMTEFEWFHTPVFVALVGLLCVNLTLVTVRKIPFNTLKLGVWMIHTGIIVMSLGATWYFATKYEGDTPVIRRAVQVSVDGVGEVTLPAKPGAEAVLHDYSVTADGEATEPADGDGGGGGADGTIDDRGAHGHWRFEIDSVMPEYTMLTAGMEGEQDFAVRVRVTRPDGETFFRQLLQKHPEIVEDAIMTTPSEPGGRPMQRVKNVEGFGGRLLFDDRVGMRLTFAPQDHFWVKDSFAIALRERGDGGGSAWDQRLLDGMPRYNDYIDRPDDIWPPVGVRRIALDPLRIDAEKVGVADDDAAAAPAATDDIDVRVTGFLRYAVLEDRWAPGGASEAFNPVAVVHAMLDGGHIRRVQLSAFDPAEQTAFDGLLGFYWVEDEAALERLRDRSRGGVLRLLVGDVRERIVLNNRAPATDADPFEPLGDTGWGYRVRQVVNRLSIPGLNDGTPVSVVEVELESPEGEVIRRWVFDDDRLTRDLPSGVDLPTATAGPGALGVDDRIVTTFTPPAEDVVIAAGPTGIGVRLMRRPTPGGQPVEQAVSPGEVVGIADGVGLSVRQVLTNPRRVTKPNVVPLNRRQQDLDRALLVSLARVELRMDGEVVGERWASYHPYSFEDTSLYAGRLGRYEPAVFELADGRVIEAIFTREKRPLPHDIALEEFELRSHVGGFTGESLSIRDWVSHLRFRDEPSDEWSATREVRVNSPREQDGVWYFQSFWDPPLENEAAGVMPSGGKTFTGLGVGNREGVYTTLAGATLSVIGMMYAFYVKPIIKRRRQERVYASLAASGADPGAAAGAARVDVETADRDVASEMRS